MRLLTTIIFLCSCSFAVGQSLLHSKPLDYNPSFAGNADYARFSMNVTEVSANSNQLYFSYDKLAKEWGGGIGFYASVNDYTLTQPKTQNIYNRDRLGFVYAPKFILRNNYLLSTGIDVEFSMRKEVELTRIDEVAFLLFDEKKQMGINLNPSIMLNNDNFYVGYKLMNAKNYMRNNSNLLHSFQGGYNYQLNYIRKRFLIFDAKANIGSMDNLPWRDYRYQANLGYRAGYFMVGVGNNDFKYFSVMTGFAYGNVKMAYAYHILDNGVNLINNELSFQYLFNKNNREKITLPLKRWKTKFISRFSI